MEDRTGKTAYIRYRGGVAGEQPHDVRMDEPLAVRIGGHRVCKGIERALGQMEVGESCHASDPSRRRLRERRPEAGAVVPALSSWTMATT